MSGERPHILFIDSYDSFTHKYVMRIVVLRSIFIDKIFF
jgi:hypothetical protein